MKRILVYALAGLLLGFGYFFYMEAILFIDIVTRLSYYLSNTGASLLLFGIFLESGANLMEVFYVVYVPVAFLSAIVGLSVNAMNWLICKKAKTIPRYSGLIVIVAFALLFELVLILRFYPNPGGAFLEASNFMLIRFWSPVGLLAYVTETLILEFFLNKKIKVSELRV